MKKASGAKNIGKSDGFKGGSGGKSGSAKQSTNVGSSGHPGSKSKHTIPTSAHSDPHGQGRKVSGSLK